MIKKIKKYLNYFTPPILMQKNLREIYNRKFKKDEIAHHFKLEVNFFTRQAFINKAISQYKDCMYLEIGVASNLVFNTIPLKINKKFGVDPVRGGNFRLTSDEFFENYNHLKFDVVFIDGLHEYKQCQRDCLNAMKQLNKGGVIFFHDFLPRSDYEQQVPRKQSKWCGDVWKVAVELFNSKNIDFKIINIDHGIGVLKLKENFHYQKMDNLKNEGFKNFLEYKKKLPIISSEEGLDFITK